MQQYPHIRGGYYPPLPPPPNGSEEPRTVHPIPHPGTVPGPRPPVSKLALGAIIFAILATAASISLYFLSASHASSQASGQAAQIAALRSKVAEYAAADARLAGEYASLRTQVSSTNGLVVHLGQFAQTCNSITTGPDGDGQYFYPCALHQPSG